jgi:hypothetical protein
MSNAKFEGIMEKEQWIEEVLSSAKGASRAQPPADFTESVMRRIGEKPRARAKAISLKWAVAAAIMLVPLNIAVLLHYNSTVKAETHAIAEAGGTNDYNTEIVYKY